MPDAIDTGFLGKFKKIIEKNIEKGRRFLIITGGGATTRRYQGAARMITPTSKDDLDWLGIHSTRLNGHLMRTLLRTHAYPVLVTNASKLKTTSKAVIIAAGNRPGNSTDFEAVRLAEKIGAKKLINLSNIDYVYTKDPRKFSNAKPIKDITWKEFRKIIPKKWDPGLHSPFDPIASKKAQALGIEVAIINGARLGEFEKHLAGKKFVGTIIK